MDLFRLREEFTSAGIMICFNGPFSHSIIEELGVAVRNHLAAEKTSMAAVMDVFAIYIELAQNVKNYVAVRKLSPDDAKSSIITIAKQNGKYIVTSGNNVFKDDVAQFKESIETINSLGAPELRKMYKEQLRKETPEGALGAGLGLMEIAKHSSDKMLYAVRDIDDTMAFFSLTAYV